MLDKSLPLKRTFFIKNNCPFPKHLFHWNSVHMKENTVFWVKTFLPAHISLIWEWVGRPILKEKPKWKTYPLPFLNTQIYPNRQNYSVPYFTTFSWLGRSVKKKKKRKPYILLYKNMAWFTLAMIQFLNEESMAYFDIPFLITISLS